MKYLQGLHVLILGLGASGLAMARWCVRCGAASVRVADTREVPPQAAVLRAELPGVPVISGALTPALLDPFAEGFEAVQLVLCSPGLVPHSAAMKAVSEAAQARAVAVQGELSLWAAAMADLKADWAYAPAVVAITGTNGKTTTAMLTALLIERSDWRVAWAGNMGPTLLDTLAKAMEGVKPEAAASDTLPQAWVLELSSFQLAGIPRFEPTVAAVLNLSEDHLDWHGSLSAYSAAKARVYGEQACMVVNADDPQVLALVDALNAAALESPAVDRAQRRGAGRAPQAMSAPRQIVHFGAGPPRQAGDFGLVQDGGMSWLARLQASEVPQTNGRRRARRGQADEDEAPRLQHLMPTDALRIRGRHNAVNALAALALATAIGRPLAPMLHALRDYRGEPHRVEWVSVIDGVEVYDDSKGTNVGATVAALRGLGEERQPAKLVVILGGDGKGQDFTPLQEVVQRFARAVALIGRDAPALEAALSSVPSPSWVQQRFETLEAATCWSLAQARQGDAVLLSPACASLDMFRDYAHRAAVFRAAVAQWAAERGEATV